MTQDSHFPSKFNVPEHPYKTGDKVLALYEGMYVRAEVISCVPDVCKEDGFLGFNISLATETGKEIAVIDTEIYPFATNPK